MNGDLKGQSWKCLKSYVWFQKIPIPTPGRVIGNSKGEGVSKSKMFKGMYEPILELGWGFKPKIPLLEGYGFFLEHNIQCNIPNLYVTVIREENTIVLQTFYS